MMYLHFIVNPLHALHPFFRNKSLLLMMFVLNLTRELLQCLLSMKHARNGTVRQVYQ
jgi:hypothetical protein